MKITILDAGAKFGLHPSWRQYGGPAQYYMFEPDQEEAKYLQEKYADRSDIEVLPTLLDATAGKQKLLIYAHPGGNSVFEPNDSLYWTDLRPGTSEIIDEIKVESVTVDGWAKEHGVQFDFMKIDVEGKEIEVLNGAEQQLKDHVLGVRCEVLLNSLYKDLEPTFGGVGEYLRECGFIFLNFDNFSGNSQARFSEFSNTDRFGMLIALDGLWIKPPSVIEGNMTADTVYKYAAFGLTNNVQDLAMSILIKAAEPGITFSDADASDEESLLACQWLEKEVAALLFSLRDTPRYDNDLLASTFKKIFKKEWVKPGEYYRRYPM